MLYASAVLLNPTYRLCNASEWEEMQAHSSMGLRQVGSQKIYKMIRTRSAEKL